MHPFLSSHPLVVSPATTNHHGGSKHHPRSNSADSQSPTATVSVSESISTKRKCLWPGSWCPGSPTKQWPDHSIWSHPSSVHCRRERSVHPPSPSWLHFSRPNTGVAGYLKSLNDLAKTAKADYILHTGDFGFYDNTSLERIAEK
jgi:hypothetical protein